MTTLIPADGINTSSAFPSSSWPGLSRPSVAARATTDGRHKVGHDLGAEGASFFLSAAMAICVTVCDYHPTCEIAHEQKATARRLATEDVAKI